MYHSTRLGFISFRGAGLLPVLVLPDAEPFDQVLSALQFGMKTVLLPLEPRHVLHRHTKNKSRDEAKFNHRVKKI